MASSPEIGFEREIMEYMADRHAKLGPEIYEEVIDRVYQAGLQNSCDAHWALYSVVPSDEEPDRYREVLLLDEAKRARLFNPETDHPGSIRITVNDVVENDGIVHVLTEDFSMTRDGRIVRFMPGAVRIPTGNPEEDVKSIQEQIQISTAAVYLYRSGETDLIMWPGYANGLRPMDVTDSSAPGEAVTPYGNGTHVVDQLYAFSKAQEMLAQLESARIIGIGKA